MSGIVIIGGIESTYRNAQVLHDLGEEIVMFYTRGERSPGWEGVAMIDETKFPFASKVPKTVVQGNINDHTEEMRKLKPDFIFSLGWQQMYRSAMLNLCPVVGIHESLLPEGAGAVPIANAILYDRPATGVSLFWLDGGMDTGPLIAQLRGRLDPRTATATELYNEAMELEEIILRAMMPVLSKGVAPRIPQDFSKRTVYDKIDWDAWPEEKVRRARTYPMRDVVAFVAREPGYRCLTALADDPMFRLRAVYTHRRKPTSEDPERGEREDFVRFRDFCAARDIPMFIKDTFKEAADFPELPGFEPIDYIVSCNWKFKIPVEVLKKRAGGRSICTAASCPSIAGWSRSSARSRTAATASIFPRTRWKRSTTPGACFATNPSSPRSPRAKASTTPLSGSNANCILFIRKPCTPRYSCWKKNITVRVNHDRQERLDRSHQARR
ncbi:MAG: formyltransferase family protein [Deltaproteobacteria bacterium]|nr:formyltransferase family protein [Deltaproteobacteria bacterium]